MAIFEFKGSEFLGDVVSVDTRRVWLNVESEKLREARVGRLVAIKAQSAVEEWLIAIVDKVVKRAFARGESTGGDATGNDAEQELNSIQEGDSYLKEDNKVRVTLIGTVRAKLDDRDDVFTRSILTLPEIEAQANTIEGKALESFMGIISKTAQGEHALDIGHFTMDPNARAYLDGNRFFQRHAALLGSTGSGKSWTVATMLERAKDLPTSNIILFDLHGEYSNLDYARHLKVAGPDDLNKEDPSLLFLPYWLLNAEEMQAMFIDRTEFSAHNQVMAFQDAVTAAKKEQLRLENKLDVLNAFTIDSPVPFSLDAVIDRISELNTEMTQGSRGIKQGNFYGQFSRLLVRVQSKIKDKRYGFLFQAPQSLHSYNAFNNIAASLMRYRGENNQVKIIDFSEVPSDMLPVIVGLVARLVFQLQFWTAPKERQPIAFFCDEAHLYLPKKNDSNPIEKRALENFERIAKEGRKYGVGLVVISQRPADVSETILSQCNNFISLRLTNATDQAVVKKLLPDSLESLVEVLPILDIGEAVIVGDAVLLPTRIKIAPPQEQNCPKSGTLNFWNEWSAPDKSTTFALAVENMRRQSRRAIRRAVLVVPEKNDK